MRVCIDIDGTICETDSSKEYAEVSPIRGARVALIALKQEGHHIILFTARHMKTCKGDADLAENKQRGTLEWWLGYHEIPYDELIFGKPYADIYIDDKGYKFEDWGDTLRDNF